MNEPCLMILSDAAAAPGSPGEERWLDEVLPAVLGGARPGTIVVQLRHKDASARRRLSLAERLRQITAEQGQLLLVNDRVDLARAVAADGVHLPEEGMSVTQARALLGSEGWWISRAWHGEPFGAAAQDSMADLLILSPVLEPRKGRAALGRAGIEAVLAGAWPPEATGEGRPRVFGLGGVSPKNVVTCRAAGLAGVAVLGGAATREGGLALVDALGIRASLER